MTRDELIAELQKYPADVQVKITWETTVHAIKPENLYLSKDGVLLIDADDNNYKKDFESGELSAVDGWSVFD